LALVPSFAFGTPHPALLAISLGGVLLAHRGFEKLAWGLWHLVDARVAWGQVRMLSEAAGRPELIGSPAFAAAKDHARDRDQEPVLEASELVFRYRDRGESLLRGCSLILRDGDRVLLRGPSGGGKSTFASLLVGLRSPDSGVILSRGLDRKTLGSDAWCRRVVSAPQFHENHVLNDTFAFNLLMGRSWPPSPEDMREAEVLCRDLGLGSLLERMPAGLLQMVGESGWQLSHGERSRLFMARALLQEADVIILDESFAALDPENLEQCLRTVRDRARTLLVIAHY
jgi:ATP-binding cassette subfamily B protein